MVPFFATHTTNAIASSSEIGLKLGWYVCLLPFSCAQEADTGYWRLTPSQPVGLNHASCVISVNDVIKVFNYIT